MITLVNASGHLLASIVLERGDDDGGNGGNDIALSVTAQFTENSATNNAVDPSAALAAMEPRGTVTCGQSMKFFLFIRQP